MVISTACIIIWIVSFCNTHLEPKIYPCFGSLDQWKSSKPKNRGRFWLPSRHFWVALGIQKMIWFDMPTCMPQLKEKMGGKKTLQTAINSSKTYVARQQIQIRCVETTVSTGETRRNWVSWTDDSLRSWIQPRYIMRHMRHMRHAQIFTLEVCVLTYKQTQWISDEERSLFTSLRQALAASLTDTVRHWRPPLQTQWGLRSASTAKSRMSNTSPKSRNMWLPCFERCSLPFSRISRTH